MLKITASFLSICLLTSSCSLANYGSQEALAGSATGGLLGGAVGYAIAQKTGNTKENVLINAGIGTGVGLLGGALVNQRNVNNAKKREVVVREAKLISKNQMELDKLRKEIYDSSSWGNNEVDTWDKRYEGEYRPEPFQGNTSYQHPKQ